MEQPKGYQNPFEPSSDDDASVYNPFEHTPVKPVETNEKPSSGKLAEVRKHLDEAKDATIIAVDKALKRDSELDALLDKTDELMNSSDSFRHKSKALRKQMWWDYIKKKSLLIFVVLVILAILVLIIVMATKKH